MAFQRILVGTDLSPASERAYQTALAYAGPETEIRLVHVLPLIMAGLGARGLAETSRDAFRTLDEAAIASARQTLVKWEKDAGETKVRHKILHGTVAAGLAQEAEDWQADLMVVSGGERSRLERFFVGSRARSILHTAPTNLLVVHAESAAPPKHVAVAVDFGEPSKAAAQVASKVAAVHGSDVLAFHAIDADIWWGSTRTSSEMAAKASLEDLKPKLAHEMESMLADFAQDGLPAASSLVVEAGRPDELATQLVEDRGVDLVVTGTHGHGAFKRFFLGSVAQSLVERVPCNVLVAREESA